MAWSGSYRDLCETGEYRFLFNTRATTALNSWLSWQVTFNDGYVSNPPPLFKENDLLFSTGLGLTFGKGGLDGRSGDMNERDLGVLAASPLPRGVWTSDDSLWSLGSRVGVHSQGGAGLPAPLQYVCGVGVQTTRIVAGPSESENFPGRDLAVVPHPSV